MRRILAALGLALAFVATSASAQLTTYTFATLPTSPTAGQLAKISDGSGAATVGAAAAGAGANVDTVAWDPVDARWEFVSRALVPGPVTALTPYLEALRVGFNNTASALVAGNLQDAIDELALYVKRGGKIGVDRDGDGYYEQAWFHDADADGSGFVTCTAAAGVTGAGTPDIQCKAQGEKIARDFIDDTNYMIHRLMGPGSVIDYPLGVFVGYPCWNPTSGLNDPLTAETTSAAHDQIGDAIVSQCARDAENNPLVVVSAQGKSVTLRGSGADRRLLERGSMSITKRRDQGTYFVNDMGPWDNNNSHNNWLGFTGNLRFISGGYHTVHGQVSHTGAGAWQGDSKGWGDIVGSTDPNFDLYIGPDTTQICVANTNNQAGSAGAVGTDFSASGWASNLEAGDLMLVPVKESTNSPAFSVYEMVLHDKPVQGGCAAGHMALTFGGAFPARSGSYLDKVYPPHAGNQATGTVSGIIASGQRIAHARSDYQATDFVVENVRIEPGDPWNEWGGRCRNDTTNNSTDDGAAFRSTIGSAGSPFKLIAAEGTPNDDGNFDLSCDTHNLTGFWGSGRVTIQDSVLASGHQFWHDGGNGSGVMTAQRNTYLFGNGKEIADADHSWRFLDNLVDRSYFTTNVITSIGPGLEIDGLIVRDSVASQLIQLANNQIGAKIRNVTFESTAHSTGVLLACGARFNLIDNIRSVGRAVYTYGSYAGLVYAQCDQTSNPITLNSVSNLFEEPPGSALATEQVPLVVLDAPSATTGTMGPFAAIKGNVFSGAFMEGYAGAGGGEDACLFGVREADSDDPQGGSPGDADDGESVVFSTNFFANSSVGYAGNGRAFCVTNAISNQGIDRELLGTGAQPQACGVMDGGTTISYGVCR